MTTRELDQAKVQAFTQQVFGIIAGGRLSLMLSIGHRTGLFDTLAALPPATSAEVAAAAGLQERYVREWLGAMVTGGIVDYDPAGATYRLPPEHAPPLTRAGGLRNVGVLAQATGLLARVEDRVVACFREGGGVPYEALADFTQLTAELTGRGFDANLLERTLPLVPGLLERLQQGIDVADIACGSGHAINLMARAFPASRFTGYDFSPDALAAARAEAQAWGLTNATFVEQDVAALDLTDAFDFITVFDAVHDQAHPARVLAAIARALRPGGTFLMVDIAASSNLEENIGHPLAPSLYAMSTLHCMTVSLAQGGEGLGAMWGEQRARQLLAEAGFTEVEVRRVEGDIVNNYYIASTR